MDDACFVRELETLGDLRDESGGSREGQATFSLEDGAQALALEQLHRDVRLIAVDAVVENVDDVRAFESSRCSGFSPEAHVVRLAPLHCAELDRDLDVQLHVARNPQRPHAALRQRALEQVFSGDELPALP